MPLILKKILFLVLSFLLLPHPSHAYTRGMSKAEQVSYIKKLDRYTREALIADFSLTFTKDGSWPPENATYVATDGTTRAFWPDVKKISGHDWEKALQCWRNHKKLFHRMYMREITAICNLNADKGFKNDIGIRPPVATSKSSEASAMGTALPISTEPPEKTHRRLKSVFANLPENGQLAVIQALIKKHPPEDFLSGITITGSGALPTYEALKAEKCLDKALDFVYSATANQAVSTLLLNTYASMVKQEEKNITRRRARLQASIKAYEAQVAAKAAAE